MKFGHVFPAICTWRDRQTDRQTDTHHNTPLPYQRQSKCNRNSRQGNSNKQELLNMFHSRQYSKHNIDGTGLNMLRPLTTVQKVLPQWYWHRQPPWQLHTEHNGGQYRSISSTSKTQQMVCLRNLAVKANKNSKSVYTT